MKTKVKAAEFKKTMNAVLALQRLTPKKSKKDDMAIATLRGCLEVVEGRLLLQSANMGAYVELAIDSKTLRPGAVGVDLTMLANLRMSGEATIELNDKTKKLKIYGKGFSYDLATDQEAATVVKMSKPDSANIKSVAKVPSKLLALSSAMVALKPGLKQEEMRTQFSMRPLEDGMSWMEITGSDHYSYGRFVRKSKSIKVRTPTRFILRSISLATVLSSVSSESVVIGVELGEDDETAKLVQFKARDADIYYPTLNLDFIYPNKVYKHTTAGEKDCGFTVLRKNVREALNTVKTVASGNVPLILTIRVGRDKVQMAAENNGNVAVATIPAQNVQLADKNPRYLLLNQSYFSEVVTLAPEVVPMRIESWNGKQAIIRGEKVENGRIEYFLSQVDSKKLAAEGES